MYCGSLYAKGTGKATIGKLHPPVRVYDHDGISHILQDGTSCDRDDVNQLHTKESPSDGQPGESECKGCQVQRFKRVEAGQIQGITQPWGHYRSYDRNNLGTVEVV